MVQVSHLLVNFLFVIFPYLFMEVFFPHNIKSQKYLFTSLTAVSILLCMTFPIIRFSGQVVDLRFIPFLLGFLYGGWRSGVILLIILCSYRFVLGGPGAYTNLISYILLLIPLFPANNYFHRVSKKIKVRLVIGLTLLHYAIIIGGHIMQGASSIVDFWILLIQPTMTIFMTFLIEKHRDNQAIREQIYHSEKLQAISEIAASVSHEIRNPLTVVRGFVQLLLQDQIAEKHHAYLTLSMEELDRAEKIITDYLAYARPHPDKLESVPLGEELYHVVSILRPYGLMNKVEIALSVPQETNVWGDRLKLRQSLLNIMKNGIEAMPEGGILTVQLHRMSNMVYIYIRDTGVGMVTSQIQRLGTPYYSLKEKGTGLGTMVSFRVVESMKGKITVDSQVGVGTTFTISFPI